MNHGNPAAGNDPAAKGVRNRSAARSTMLRLYVCSSGFHVDFSLGAASVQLFTASSDCGWPAPWDMTAPAALALATFFVFAGAFVSSSGRRSASSWIVVLHPEW